MLEFEVYPLSFEEFENMKEFYQIPLSPDPREELTAFILEGGFPRAVHLESLGRINADMYRESLMKSLKRTFEKDLRFGKRIPSKNCRAYIINNFGGRMSIMPSIYRALKGE